jgi:hypothetical protein
MRFRSGGTRLRSGDNKGEFWVLIFSVYMLKKYLPFSGIMYIFTNSFIVAFGDWVKNPRLQAKAIVRLLFI